MNMPLAACLPDFGSADGSGTAADGALPAAAQQTSAPTPFAALPEAISEAVALRLAARERERERENRPKSAGDTLKSIVRHIKLVDEPGFVTPVIDPAPPVDIDALLKEHGDRVREAEADKAKAAIAAALAEERRAQEERLRQERARWVAAEALPLAQQIEARLSQLEDELSQTLAGIFVPFLKQAVRDRAVGELRDTVLAMLADTDQPRLEVSGPADLVEHIRNALAASAPERIGQISFAVAPSADVRVTADDTICATQIGAWDRRIEAALGLSPA